MEMTKIVGKLDMAPMKLEIQAPMFCTQLRLKDKDEILNLKLRGCLCAKKAHVLNKEHAAMLYER